MIGKFFKFLIKDDITSPPWEYFFLQNLDEKEYPLYLAKLFKLNTGESLPLKYNFKSESWIIDKKKCKTFNQKLQWLKLYGVTDLIRNCTDKVKIRDYISKKIGLEYLKPVLQIIPGNLKSTFIDNDFTTYFDQINWKELPDSFIIKCNNGYNWQYIIKNKEKFIQSKKLYNIVKQQTTSWLEHEYWCFDGFQLQYKNIKSQIIIEEFLACKNEAVKAIEVYCFNGKPKIIKLVHNDVPNNISMFDENLNNIDFKFSNREFLVEGQADNLIRKILVLSENIAKDFNFVRVDWLILNKKIYFNDLNFIPNSGLIQFNQEWNKKLGKYLNLK